MRFIPKPHGEFKIQWQGDVFFVEYFDVWNDAARELVDSVRDSLGFDFSADLLNWSRRGVFMYSNVHPMHFVLNDVAKHLWRRVGLPLREENLQLYGIDDLGRAEVFPVYPPIAKMFGVKGSYLFKLANHRLNYSVGDFLTLPQYLSACYKTYAAVPSDKLSCARVDGWTADAAVSEYPALKINPAAVTGPPIVITFPEPVPPKEATSAAKNAEFADPVHQFVAEEVDPVRVGRLPPHLQLHRVVR